MMQTRKMSNCQYNFETALSNSVAYNDLLEKTCVVKIRDELKELWADHKFGEMETEYEYDIYHYLDSILDWKHFYMCTALINESRQG